MAIRGRITMKAKQQLLIPEDFDGESFELFKSNVCQYIKRLPPKEKINFLTNNYDVNEMFKAKNYPSCLYIVALYNYLCDKYHIDKNDHFKEYDSYILSEEIYPRGIMMISYILQDNKYKEIAKEKCDKHFLSFNIIEGEIENVY